MSRHLGAAARHDAASAASGHRRESIFRYGDRAHGLKLAILSLPAHAGPTLGTPPTPIGSTIALRRVTVRMVFRAANHKSRGGGVVEEIRSDVRQPARPASMPTQPSPPRPASVESNVLFFLLLENANASRLSLTHTHTHTHRYTLSENLFRSHRMSTPSTDRVNSVALPQADRTRNNRIDQDVRQCRAHRRDRDFARDRFVSHGTAS